VLVDNGARAHPSVDMAMAAGARVLANRNRGGLAGAYNLALEHLAPLSVTHVVFLDEDSDSSVLEGFLNDPLTGSKMDDAEFAAVAPIFRDRATGMRAAPIVLSRWRFRVLPRESRGLQRVDLLINSMSVWRIEAVERIGRFNEGLGVDQIDVDYCLRARSLGLKLAMNFSHEFAHSLGQRIAYRFLGRTMQASGYDSTQRRYLFARNIVWLAKQNTWHVPSFGLLCLARLLHESLGILAVETNKASRLRSLIAGAWNGLWSRNLVFPPPAARRSVPTKSNV
jgi:rhamnosyltransferase